MRTMMCWVAAIALLPVPSSAESAVAWQRQGYEPEASRNILDLPARLDVEDVPLSDALKRLEDFAGIGVAYSPSLLPHDLRVSCRCADLTVGEAARTILRGTLFEIAAFPDHLVIRNRKMPTVKAVNVDLSPEYPSSGFVGYPGTEPTFEVHLPPAQLQGTIMGRVIDAETGEPIASAQVHLPQLDIGSLTQADGRFVLANVPAGTHTVEVRRIGYRVQSRTIAVEAEETVEVNFELAQQALDLDEIVVTGTAGQARRREVGNTISQINMDDVTDLTSSTDQLLQAQSPGISVVQSGGVPGQGSRIRLRGNTSVAMGNQPLIYVDGVRIQSNSPPANIPIDGSTARGAHIYTSPMNDLNAADIERIEVIKGAAATTLYGAEASAGVIQIFTRKGVTGDATWTARADVGLDTPRKFGPPTEPYMRMDPGFILRTGVRQRYELSVRGGLEQLGYFLSTGFEDNTGVLPADGQEKFTVRGNFSISPHETLHLDYSTGYTKNFLQHTPQGNNSRGVTTIAHRAYNSSLGADWRETIHRQWEEWEITNDHSHLITGLTINHVPTDWLTNRVTLGMDRMDIEMRNVRPFDFQGTPQGVVNNTNFTQRVLTLDYVSNVQLAIASNFETTLSAGGQFVRNTTRSTSAYSDNLPGPGIPTVSSGARRLSAEDLETIDTGGAFFQALLGYLDRYFLTAGVRVDGNSAFGQDFGFQVYPKVSASYVISDEGFWSSALGEMKLRAAYGHAGRAPGAFDAVRTWIPVGFSGEPAFYPGNVGNPNLGPETTKEVELGFDSDWFDGRLLAEFTYFHATVDDALLPVEQIPTLGFTGSQLENVGTIENSGIELGVEAVALDRSWGSWTIGVSASTANSEVIDLGEASEFSVGSNGRIIEGEAVPVIVGTKLLNPDEIAEPEFQSDHIFGAGAPTTTFTVSTSLSLPHGIRVSARGEYMGGHAIYMSGFNSTIGRLAWPECEVRGYEFLEQGRRDELTAYERTICDPSTIPPNFPIFPASFFKMRDITLQLPIPDRILPVRLDDATVRFSLRNYFGWQNDEFPFYDPESNFRNGDLNQLTNSIDEANANPKQFTASVRVRF